MIHLTASLAIEMVRVTAQRLEESAAELSRMDAVAGDGDHGVNMATAFHNADAKLADSRPTSAGDAFVVVGRSFSEAAGGSAGALFGALFATLGARVLRSAEPSGTDFVEGLELASRRVALIGRTAVGSKTMLDALVPAVEAARGTVTSGGDLTDVLAAAAAASARGAAATADMRAAAGRARHAQNGAIGTRDPGAVTVSIMFAAWADVVTASVAS